MAVSTHQPIQPAMLTQAPLAQTVSSTNERIGSYRHHALGSLVTIWRDHYATAHHITAVWQSSSGAVVGTSWFRNLPYLRTTLVDLGYEEVTA